MELQQERAIQAENSLAALQTQWQDYTLVKKQFEALRTEAGLLEEEPEETHRDRGTQTKDDVMEQCLPPNKRPIQIEEESP